MSVTAGSSTAAAVLVAACGYLDTSSILSLSLASSTIDIAGVRLRKRQVGVIDEAKVEPGKEVVITQTSLVNLRRLAFAISLSDALGRSGRPILLEGPPGSGKTTLLRYIGRSLGFLNDMVELHLDDSTDGKSLLGTYVCTDVPGEFKWQPGAITSAAVAGRWLLVEDIDRAPFDVLASLGSLLESRTLVLPGRSKTLQVHPNFQLFATRSCTYMQNQKFLLQPTSGALSAFIDRWLRVLFVLMGSNIENVNRTALEKLSLSTSKEKENADGEEKPSNSNELLYLLTCLFPSLPTLGVLDQMMVCHAQLERAFNSSSRAQSGKDAEPLVFPLSLERFGRTFSARDVIRWAMRVDKLTLLSRKQTFPSSSFASGAASMPVSHPVFLTESEKLAIVNEGIAVVSSHIPFADIRRSVARSIGAIWGLSTDAVDELIDFRKPSVGYSFGSLSSLNLTIGDIVIPIEPKSPPHASFSLGRTPQPLPHGFAPTRHSMNFLERLAACVRLDEPALLVGETGNGKTSVIQALASACGKQLLVYNVNVQSDSADLVGGFKPVHLRQIAIPLLQRFEVLFSSTFQDSTPNQSFMEIVKKAVYSDDWAKTIGGFMRAIQRAHEQKHLSAQMVQEWSAFSEGVKNLERQFRSSNTGFGEGDESGSSVARKRPAFAFSFVDGVLVQALRQGHWLLLDEINLASAETLQRLAGLLEGGSVTLTEKGDADPVPRHPSFRLFAAMNPATDFGKRNLPPALRARFSEIYVPDVESEDDLSTIVSQYVSTWPSSRSHIAGGVLVDSSTLIGKIVSLYLHLRRLSAPITGCLRDGASSRPHYSLRSLTRSLQAASILIEAGFEAQRACREGFCVFFVTQLEDGSAKIVLDSMRQYFGGSTASQAPASSTSTSISSGKKKDNKQSQLALDLIARLGGSGGGGQSNHPSGDHDADTSSTNIPRPRGMTGSDDEYILSNGFWLHRGPNVPKDLAEPDESSGAIHYVLVPSVKRHLRSLSRAIACRRFPVLLQGPTSAGKTSMIEYLAKATGHECVRINNHEHTDIAEYVGSYTSTPQGRLEFAEGLLVKALRRGNWLILDELNLAPSEVLEALNRLLDDNRELFIPETQETVRPHSNFMLFATQNPSGAAYGGRKPLSLAFRNRFIELHIDDIPSAELHTIIMLRSRLPSTFVEKMISVMQELQRVRQASDIFAGSHGFITPRDLLRWAQRQPRSFQTLAEEGFALLGERLRIPSERDTVKRVLETTCKVVINLNDLYDAPFSLSNSSEDATLLVGSKRISTRTIGEAPKRARLSGFIASTADEESSSAAEVKEAMQNRLQSFLSFRRELRRTGVDPVGVDVNLRPGSISGTEGLSSLTVTRSLRRLFDLVGRCIANDEPVLLVGDTGCGKTTIIQLFALLLQHPLHVINCHVHTETADILGSLRPVRGHASSALFEWCDGPLVQAMKNGDFFLLDEASLAEDAVLERLNSVLEPSRSLTLAEKADDAVVKDGTDSRSIKAASSFRIFATMNPGGDFGKRELSPALRNRFTEIWVPSLSSDDDKDGEDTDLRLIITEKAADVFSSSLFGVAPANGNPLLLFVDPILRFVKWFERNASQGLLSTPDVKKGSTILKAGGSRVFQLTLRDLHSWLAFMGATLAPPSNTTPWEAYTHGACLVLLDGLGLGMGLSPEACERVRNGAAKEISSHAPILERPLVDAVLWPSRHAPLQRMDALHDSFFGISPFFIPMGSHVPPSKVSFALEAPTTRSNLVRVLRALQLRRPVLLEGSPGVGKTSLIEAIARQSGHKLVRINLSDQTDVSDLFGQDLPAVSNEDINHSGSKFAWCDGVFLQALRRGDWVLLDELNLAPQAVLESLNAVLDHRGTVYIPELDQTFPCAPGFQVFATQNPVGQGGGRKGLPKSFLNRFAKVYVESLTTDDQLFIARSIFPQLDVPLKHPLGGFCGERPDSTALTLMAKYCEALHADTMGHPALYGQEGRPWEFNLRDLFRWCDLVILTQNGPSWNPGEAVEHVLWTRLRSLTDRAAAAARFLSIFGFQHGKMDVSPQSASRIIASLITLNSSPVLRLNTSFFSINDVLVPRALLLGSWEPSPMGAITPQSEGKHLALKLLESTSRFDSSIARYFEEHRNAGSSVGPLTPSLLCSMYHCARAVISSSPVLLVGRRSTGKSASLVHLAQLCGARLRIVPLTPSTDATELVGCFEQADPTRQLDNVLDAATGLVHGFLAALSALESSTDLTDSDRQRIQSTSSSLRDLTSTHVNLQVVDSILIVLDSSHDILSSESFSSRVTSLRAQVSTVKSSIDNVVAERGSFEWVDGTLVEAMERGEWVVVENVNFCAASVVDRLNPMLEPGGSLLISEFGLDASGSPRVVRASPSFRIFFTLDPSLGDVSRALRNRCVEISLTSDDEQLGESGSTIGNELAKKAVDKVLSTSSVPSSICSAAHLMASRISSSALRINNTRAFALSSADANDGPLLASVSRGAIEAHEAAIKFAVSSSTSPPRFRQLVYLGDALRALSRIHLSSPSRIGFVEDALIAFDLIYRNYASTETARASLATSIFNIRDDVTSGLPTILELAPMSAVPELMTDLEPILPQLLALAHPRHVSSKQAFLFLAGAVNEGPEITHSRWISDIARFYLSRVPLTSVKSIRDKLLIFNRSLRTSQLSENDQVSAELFASAYASHIESSSIVNGVVPQMLTLLPLDSEAAPQLWKSLEVIVTRSNVGVQLSDLKHYCARLLLCAEESGDVALRASEISTSFSAQFATTSIMALAVTLAQRLGLFLPSQMSISASRSDLTTRSLERLLGGQALAVVASVSESIRSTIGVALQSQHVQEGDEVCLMHLRDACRNIYQFLLGTNIPIAAESLQAPIYHPNLIPTLFILWRRVVKLLRRYWHIVTRLLRPDLQKSLLSSTYQCTLSLNSDGEIAAASSDSLFRDVEQEDLLERALHKSLDFLWRFGGHPRISRSVETFKASHSIVNLLTDLKEAFAVAPMKTDDRLAEGFEGRGLRALDVVGGSMRADILGLIGTIHIVSSDLSASQQSVKASLSASDAVLLSIKRTVESRTPSPPELEDGDMDTDEGDGGGGRTSLGVDAPLLTRLHLSALSGVLMRRAVLLQPAVVEATELHCLVEERIIIASLHSLMIRDAGFDLPENNFVIPTDLLLLRINRVIAISLAATRWNPSDLVPLRVVSWILGDSIVGLLHRLRDILPSLSSSWHARAVEAGLHDHDASRSRVDDYADYSQICSRSVDTLLRRSCALYAFESRTYSLQLLASHCATNVESANNLTLVSRTVALSQFLILLLSAESIFTQSSESVLHEYRQEIKLWWKDVIISGCGLKFNTSRILESMKKGRDSRIRTLLPPVSNLFAITFTAAGMAFEHSAHPQDLSVRAFIFSARVAQLRYLLLLPSSPVDPALKPALKRAELEKVCKETRGELALRQFTRVFTLGDSFTSLVDLQKLSQHSDEEISKRALKLLSAEPLRTKYISNEVYRPRELSSSCSFAVIHAEAKGFARNMLSAEKIDNALLRISDLNSNDHSASEALAWASAAQSFAQRLRSFFSTFKDISDPLMVAVSDLACAQQSLAFIKTKALAKSPKQEARPSAQNFVSDREAAATLFQVRSMQEESTAKNALSLLIDGLHPLQSNKSDANMNLQKGAMSTLVGETTKEREAREFREVIPDHFKNHFAEFARSPQEMLTDYKAPEVKADSLDVAASISKASKDIRATPRALAEEYLLLFGASKSVQYRSRSPPFDDHHANGLLWSMSVSSLRGADAPISSKSMPRVLYELSIMSSRFSSTVQDSNVGSSTDNVGCNYYRDSNLSESTLAIRPAREFASRCYELLRTFPSNEVLAMLLRVTDQFLRLPATAPVALLLSGAQLIVTKAQEWEVNAPALYQLGDQLLIMSQLVTRWRKLELSSWSQLLLSANGEQRESAAQLFFLLRSAFIETPTELIESLRSTGVLENSQPLSPQIQKLLSALGFVFSDGTVGIPYHAAWAVQIRGRNSPRIGASDPSDTLSPIDSHLRSCFEAADRFIRAAPKGQFRVRLELLGSLSEELISLSSADPRIQQVRLRLSLIAANVCSFYSQYIVAVQDSIDEMSRPVLKTVHDQAAIHRWDEQSYYALRESAEKSHRIVFHALRDYRLVLAEPIGPVIEGFSAGKIIESRPSLIQAVKSKKRKSPSLATKAPSDSITVSRNSSLSNLKSILIQGTTEGDDTGMKIEIQNSSLSISAIRRRMLQLLTRGGRGICSDEALRVRDLNIDSIENSSSTIFEMIEELSALTEPAVSSNAKKDPSRKSAPGSSTRMMKQRALTDALRGMSRLGLSPLSSSVAPQQSEFIELMQVPLLGLNNSINSVAAVPCLQSADDYYFRSLEQVLRLRLRLASGDWHKDLAQADVRKGVGFIEHLISLMIQQRGMIRASQTQGSGLSLFVKQLEVASAEGSVMFSSLTLAKNALTVSEEAEAALSDAIALLNGGKTLLKSLARTSASAVSSSPSDASSTFSNDIVSDEAVLSGLLSNHQQNISDLGPALSSRMSALTSQFNSVESSLKVLQAARQNLGTSLPLSSEISAATTSLSCARNSQLSSDNPSFLETFTVSELNVSTLREAVCSAQNCVTSLLDLESGNAGCKVLLLKAFSIDVFTRLKTRLSSVLSAFTSLSPSTITSSPDSMPINILSLSSDLIKEAMLAVQSLSMTNDSFSKSVRSIWGVADPKTPNLTMEISNANESTEDLDEELSVDIAAITGQLFDTLDAAQLPVLTNATARIMSLIEGIKKEDLVSVSQAVALVRGVLEAHRCFSLDAMRLHKATCKLALISGASLLRLMKDGFCTPPDSDDGEAGEAGGEGSNNGEGKFHAGTGIGEGKGQKDVSDQIENEEQVLGLKGDEEKQASPNPQDKSEKDKKDKNKGLEMQSDFSGELFDVPEEEEEEEEEEKDDERDEEDADREMGKADGDNSRIVDEKLWNGSDDEDKNSNSSEDDGPQQAKSSVKGGKDRGMRAKQGDDDEAGLEDKPGSASEDLGDQVDDENEADDNDSGGAAAPNDEEEGQDIDVAGELGDYSGDEEMNKEDEKDESGEQEKDDEKADDAEGQQHKAKAKSTREEALKTEEEGELKEETQGEENADDVTGNDPKEDAIKENSIDEDLPTEMNFEGAAEEEEEKVEGNDMDEGLDINDKDEIADAPEKDADAANNVNNVDNAELSTEHENVVEGDEPDLEKPSNQNEVPSNASTQGLASRGGESRVMGESSSRKTGDSDQGKEVGKNDEHEVDHAQPLDSNTGEGDANEDVDMGDDAPGGADGTGESRDRGSWRRKETSSGAQKDDVAKKRQPGANEPNRGLRPDINPLKNPERALKHWQARLHESPDNGDSEGGGAGADDDNDVDNDDFALRSEDVDVVANRGGRAPMLAPRETDRPEGRNVAAENESADDGGQNDGSNEDAENEVDEARMETSDETLSVHDRNDDKDLDVGKAPARERKKESKESSHATKGVSGSELTNEDSVGEGKETGDRDSDRFMRDILDRNQTSSSTTLAQNESRAVTTSVIRDSEPHEMVDDDDSSSVLEVSPEILRKAYEASIASWNLSGAYRPLASDAWSALAALTAAPAARLCESLRLALEPTLASKLGGEFRVGKRINMRRVIPYIASNFRKDKIWMRRTKPNKRTYQVLLAIDDSLSMAPANRGGGGVAVEAMAVLARALARLEAGEIGIMSYGKTVNLLHPFDRPFDDVAGARCLSHFTFAQESTRTDALLEACTRVMEDARTSSGARAAGGISGVKCMQLVFIISDGIVGTGPEREKVRQWVIEASKKGLLIVLVIVDKSPLFPSHASSHMDVSGMDQGSRDAVDRESITAAQSVRFEGGQVVRSPYLANYPFPFYVVVKGDASSSLPDVLGTAVRQWISMINESS